MEIRVAQHHLGKFSIMPGVHSRSDGWGNEKLKYFLDVLGKIDLPPEYTAAAVVQDSLFMSLAIFHQADKIEESIAVFPRSILIGDDGAEKTVAAIMRQILEFWKRKCWAAEQATRDSRRQATLLKETLSNNTNNAALATMAKEFHFI